MKDGNRKTISLKKAVFSMTFASASLNKLLLGNGSNE